MTRAHPIRPLVAFSLLAACTSAPPLPPARDAGPDLAALAESQAPGREHAELAALAGEWSVSVEGPDGVAMGSGTASLTATHGGRFLELELALEFADGPVSATGTVGFDRELGEYRALWVSTLATGMTLLRGTGSLRGAGIVLRGESGGTSAESRMRLLASGELVVESSGPGPDGEPRLLRRVRYARITR
jgi:Protein of unknown function (DUF1579)